MDVDRPINRLDGKVPKSSILVRGDSAYKIARDQGLIPYDWTEAQFIEGLRGPQGYGDYDLWTQLPGNADKTLTEYYEFLGFLTATENAALVQDLVDATAAVDAAAAALAAAAGIDLSLYTLKTNGQVLGLFDIHEALKLTGTQNAAQLVANTNDWAPANFATRTVLRLDLDAARNITGIAGGSDGLVKIVRNISAFAATLKDADAGSVAANRFAFGSDQVIPAGGSMLLVYDGTLARWTSPTLVPQYLAKATVAAIRGGTDDAAYTTAKGLSDSAAVVVHDPSELVANVWTPDMSRGYNRKITLGANTTIAAPTNMVDGQTYSWLIIQDATGGRTITLNAIFEWGSEGAVAFNTTALKWNKIFGQYDATLGKVIINLKKAA